MDLKELHSFKMSDAVTFHDNLNPKLFRGQHLQPEVELQLKNIAQDFLQEIGIHDLDVRDITISGSNAAYSYTDHSDLDLHILVNMKDLPDDEVYREFFTAKKDLYNDSHDITINGIPVELYIQDATEPVTSLGEYSIKDKKWLRLPTKRRANFDQNATKAKYEKLLDVIEKTLESDKISKVNKVLKKIRQYRQAGLDKGGEFGPENLAYKALRSQGYITRLYDLRDKLHSKHLSLNGMYSNVNEIIDMPPVTKRMNIQSMYNDMQTKLRYHESSQLTPINFPMKNQIFRDEKYGLKFFLFNNEDKPVFYLGISKFHDGFKTGVVAGETEVQGQGLGWKLYKAVSDYLGVPLYSDSTQTSDSKKGIWQKLIDNYPNQVVGYDQISRKNVPINDIYQTLPQDQLKHVDDDTRRNTLLLKFLPSVIQETLDESFGIGPLQMGDMWFDIRKHAVDRLAERKVPISTAKEMLRRISTMGNKIQQMSAGQAFWVYDSTLGISMGMRLLDSGKVQWATTIIGEPRNRNARNPVVDINESFDKPYKLRWERGDKDIDAIAKLPDGNYLTIMFNKGFSQDTKEEAWSVEFYRDNSQEVTGEGDEFRVFATVLSAIQIFIKKYKPNRVIFAANKVDDTGHDSPSRANLYDKLVQRYAKSWGFRAFRADTGNKVIYELSRIKKDIAEESFDGIEISLEKENDEIMVTATANGKELGQVLFVEENGYLLPQDLEVDERYRGQGIASTMYDYVKSQGYKIRRSGQQTDAGAGFWDKHKPGKNVWEQGMAEGVNPEVTSDKYTEPSQNVRMGNFVFNARTFTGGLADPNAKGLQIRAYDPTNLKSSIGSADFIVKKDKKGNTWLESDDTEVNDKYRGKGVATMMYAFAKSLGNDIKSSRAQSTAGKNMWRKWGKDADHLVSEASGYIPSEKEKNDPRFSTALTVDVKPDSIKKNAKAFYWNTSRAGIPPTAKPSGKIY